ncbi:potassium-transporting ATPase subunit KdpB [Streptomyces sp. NPDC014894]|uniref:potassium-transporting ATPase subunit KdpB n=1 Tax=unclassified Streptomyces TaxID=2593676 RepID=UPI0036F759EF
MSTITPTRAPNPDAPTGRRPEPGRVGGGLFDPAQLLKSLPDALRKLDPRVMVKSPVMFVVLIGSVVTTALAVADPTDAFGWAITAWLWLTTVFANLAEAVAEGRGKAQADTLRKAKTDTVARRLNGPAEEQVPGTELRIGDLVVCEAGDVIPGDGDVVEGVASVDESAITGESAPVIRESGGDRSAVTGGTKVLSDRIVVKITTKPGETFIDRMINLVEGAARQRTPNEIALNILLASLTIVFLLAVVTLKPFAVYAGADEQTSLIVLTALLVCLIPTTIGALLSAIGIAGMDRLVQRNVLAMSGRAVEAAGDVSTLLLDKTGTITLGNRRAAAFVPVPGVTVAELAEAAQLSSLADETPEGRSVVDLAEAEHGLPARHRGELTGAEWIAFTAQTRMSGVDTDGRKVRKGATASVVNWVRERGGPVSDDADRITDRIAEAGGTPLLVALEDEGGARVLGVVHLKDVVKEGMRERFAELRRMGIRTVMITGDNPLTARAIAAEAGVDDFLAEATPEDKMALIKREQAGGKLVAMTGDGTNDAPALAQADVGVAMNTGTSAAKEAGNMVDLDSDPTKLIEIVEIGKQLLITRGALTTFSIANDVAKYFAIIPAMFAAAHPGLDKLNIMQLSSPGSAILSAVVFNALIIIALVPLALRGVRYRPMSADSMLRRNIAVYGLGGLIAPFIGIKLLDLLISHIPGIG